MVKQRRLAPPGYYEECVELRAAQLFALAIENAGGPDLPVVLAGYVFAPVIRKGL
jgi:hypothetical protein